MPRISIVIVSWNTSTLLERCLQSLQQEISALPVGDVETFVVDNASHDGSDEMVRRSFPWVRLLESKVNLGFAAGNNLAFRACSGDYVWLLNPDTVLMPGALTEMIDFLAEHPSVGAVGSLLLNPDGTLQPSCSPEPTLGRELWRLFHLDRVAPYAEYPMRRWPQNKPRPVDVVQGASMLVRRTVLEDVGGLDADYFMYTEEVDLCRRIRGAGWQIVWVPQSKVIHYGGQSTQQVAASMFLHLYHSKVLYFKKQQGWPAAQAYKLVLLLASLARLSFLPFVTLLGVMRGAAQDARRKALAANYLRLLLNLHRL